MQTQLAEAQASQVRAEREAGSLRDSVKSLRDVWGREVKSVREEWRRSEEKGRKEREEAVSIPPEADLRLLMMRSRGQPT